MKKIVTLFKNKKFLKTAGGVCVLIILIGTYILFQKMTGRIFIDKSLIQAPVITISPSLSGKVTEIDVKEGQTVQTGDTLAIVGSETIRADMDGLIISAPDLTGSAVNPATQLIQMIRPVNMRVTGSIDEDKGLNTLKVGQVVSFTIDALPGKTFWGYVDEISPSAVAPAFSFSTSSERPTQQFTVYAKYNSTGYPGVKNGMSAKMVVYTKTTPNNFSNK
jgi:multidrug resistance efflux pump